MSPTVKNPRSRLAAVLSGSPLYTKSGSAHPHVDGARRPPGGHSLPSSSAIMISLTGHGLPTVPGRASQSCGVAIVPPPSVAA